MINITLAVYNAMIKHASGGYPNEACGILAGHELGEGTHFFPMRNMDESSISYFMDPKEQLQVFKRMRSVGADPCVRPLEMTGVFHSHVASEAFPSQKDIRLAFYPDISYLIVSLSDQAKPILRSFKINDEKVKEEEIKIVG